MSVHTPRPRTLFYFILILGAYIKILQTKNVKKVGLAGWESESSEDKVRIELTKS